MTKFGKLVLLINAMIFSLLMCGGANVATFDGGSISLEEAESSYRTDFYEMEQQRFQLLRRAAYELAQQKIIEAEEKKTGKKIEELIKEYVDQNLRPVPEDQLNAIWEQAQGRFEGSKEDLKAQLQERERRELQNRFFGDLFNQYNFKLEAQEPVPPQIDIVIGKSPYWGPKDAQVTVVEFSDFECPYCRQMQPDVQRLKSEFSDRVKWVFMDFPLDFHPQAMPAHIAAQCAGEQQKYFEFQSRLFNVPYKTERQMDLSVERMLSIAKNIGIDVGQLTSCMEDPGQEKQKQILATMEYGSSIGVRGTPTIFINGQLLTGARDYANLKRVIESELNG